MATEQYRVGDLLVDAGTGAVMRRSRRLELPPLSFALLVSLVRRAPDVVPRQELIEQVWHGTNVNDEALSQRVRLLRESLGDEAERPHYVAAIRGWGYRIIAPVERVGGGRATSPAIAVLPFSNFSGNRDDDPLCEGLAESIIHRLTSVEGLRVIARTSSFAVGQMGLDVCQAGSRLGAGRLLEGSVHRAGDRVRVTVQLIETSFGSHVWSQKYDTKFRDVLDLEDEIAEAVAVRLREGLGAGAVTRRHQSVDPAAHQAYLEGRYHFARVGPEALARAKAGFEQAIAIDPTFAPAFDALAELFWYLGFFGGVAPRDAFAQSTWYALRALEQDESLADTHALLAMLRKELDYNWGDVERELRRARELSPESPAVRLRYAISGLLPHARFTEALAEIDEVLARDPLSLIVRWWSGAMAYLGGRVQRTLDEGQTMIALDPSHFLGHWLIAMANDLSGDARAAAAAMEKANELAGSIPFTLGFLALLQGKAGKKDAVRAILSQLARASASTYISPFASALGHIALDDWDGAFYWLDDAVGQRDPLIMPIRSYPFLEPVRHDPRYASLMQKMHLTP